VWEGDGPPPREALIARCRHAAGLVAVLTERIDEELLATCEALEVVATMGVGYDHVDVAALTRRGIPLGNTPDVVTDATADLAFGLLLAVARRICEAQAFVRAGRWRSWEPLLLAGRQISGATLGIVGLGRIGRAVAKRALGFDMTVLATSRRGEPMDGVELVELSELLARSDFVSLHVPLEEGTRHLIGEAELEAMRPGAILINTSRGGVVDQRALLRALTSGHLAGAGLDVTEPEPIAPDDVLVGLDNCVVVPHIGSATRETREAMAKRVAENLVAGLTGRRLPYCVNPEVYERTGRPHALSLRVGGDR
jgi:glyoxylate reductase